ncbi:YaeQ family protein [Propionivibrio sp.]|uniref:YaeQ family protein n=1 Tax=Propionivibrio sp. TaxID=2212460 RepID=UPI002616732D|nr:YaeQ family protein [Propionivibrio sp.]
MALKATIFKVDLALADMDRNLYENYALTLARHPSENDQRMMVRLLAFMRYADPSLTFGKGLSTDEEPDLWLKDLTGIIDLWIVVGQPDERWLRKASGRARRVVLFSYGGRVAEMWWEQNRATLEKLPNLTVFRLPPESTQALAALANRAMHLQCMIQDGEMLITGEGESVRIEPALIFGSSG